MENKDLLYELEYKVNELKQQYLSEVKYNELTIREVLDLGFNNTNIMLDFDNSTYKESYNLGYKWKIFDTKENKDKFGYETSDYGYTDLYVELVNEEDIKYFKIKE